MKYTSNTPESKSGIASHVKISRSRFFIYALILASVFLIVGYFVYKERAILLGYKWQLRLDFLTLFIVLHTGAMLFQAGAWHLAMSRFTGERRLGMDLSVYTISLVSRRIPSPIWYIGSRFLLYPQELVSSKIVAIVTGLELLLVGLAGIICYLIFLPFYSFSYNWPWAAFVIIGGLFLLIVIIRPSVSVDLINGLLRLLRKSPISVKIKRADLVIWIFLYLVTWILDGMSLFAWTHTVIHNSLLIIDVIGISTIAALVGYVSQFLPTALVLKEITMGALLGLWVPVSVSLVVAFGYRLATIIVEVVLAIIVKISFRKKSSSFTLDRLK